VVSIGLLSIAPNEIVRRAARGGDLTATCAAIGEEGAAELEEAQATVVRFLSEPCGVE